MNKIEMLAAIESARQSKCLSKSAIAKAVGLHTNSIDKALSRQGNPRLSTLSAILDAVGLELQLVPKGFGMPTKSIDDVAYVPSVVDVALGRKP